MALELVRPQKISRDEVIFEFEHAWKSLASLEKRSGLDSRVIKGLQLEYDPYKKNKIKLKSRENLPAVQESLPFPEPLSPPPTAAVPVAPTKLLGRTYSQLIWGIVAIWIGVVLGASGIIVNCQYWYAVGGSNHLVSMIFCAIGGTVDSITIAIPSWAAELRKRKNYLLCGIAAIAFFPFASVSIIASAGFSGTHIGDTTQVRSDTMTSKERLGKEIERKVVERSAITVTDLPEVIEIQIQNERGRIPKFNLALSNDCTDTTRSDQACRFLKQLRSDKAKAERRIVLDAEIKQDTTRYEAMPSISSKDPAAEHASQMTFGLVRPEMVESYLINAMAAAPILAGLFFAIATALLR